MNYAIFGARDGEWVKNQIEKDTDSKIVCMIDNNSQLQDGYIVSAESAVEKYNNKEIDAILVAVRNGYNRQKITKQLQDMGVKNIGLVQPSVITYKWPFDIDQVFWIKDLDKPLIHYLEIHAIDACNLNCKGCLHFSSLFSQDETPDFEEQLLSLKRLSEKCEIFHLRILGGEPLLNPNLGNMIAEIRKMLPKSDIGIVTNGTLILKQKKELFEIMKNNRVGFNITLYPPTHNLKEAIYKYLEEHGVSYGSHIAKMDEFTKGFRLKPLCGEIKSHTVCVSKNCFFLWHKKLFKCAPDALINRFYERYGIDLHNESGIDIFDDSIDWNKLIGELYEKPVPLCRYCNNELETYTWGVANPPMIEDWIVED